MLFGRQAPRGLVYEHTEDVRKSFDGLHAIASQVSQEDALWGLLFLFVNLSIPPSIRRARTGFGASPKFSCG